jgi:hypothetical protein
MLTNINISIDETRTLCGLTDEILTKKLKEGLEAERLCLASFKGKFRDERRARDVPTRLKVVDLIGRI